VDIQRQLAEQRIGIYGEEQNDLEARPVDTMSTMMTISLTIVLRSSAERDDDIVRQYHHPLTFHNSSFLRIKPPTN